MRRMGGLYHPPGLGFQPITSFIHPADDLLNAPYIHGTVPWAEGTVMNETADQAASSF